MEDENLSPETEEEEKDRSISSDLIRGHINTIILRSLYDGDKYGYEIISEIERKSSGQYSLKQPSLYSALKRLEKDGYITSYWGGSVSGGRRKYFSLTDEGKAISEQNQAEWEYSRTIIDSLISDRDFDFSNPAPTAVDMRMLRRSTSRAVGKEEGEEDEGSFTPIFDDSAEREKLAEEYAQKSASLEADYVKKNEELEQAYMQRVALLGEEYSQKNAQLEAESARLAEEYARLEEEKRLSAASVQADENALKERLAFAENELTYRDRAIEEAKKHIQDLRGEREDALSARSALEDTLKERDAMLAEERTRHEQELDEARKQYEAELEALNKQHAAALEEAKLQYENEATAARLHHEEELVSLREHYEAALEEAEKRHERDLLEKEAVVRAEMEEEFKRREQEIKRQNYIDLVNAPPAVSEEEPRDFNYLASTASAAHAAENEPAPLPAPVQSEQAEPSRDYRTVVHRLYSGATTGPSETIPRAQSIDGIDFTDLESRASQDKIRLVTSGGSQTAEKGDRSENLVHKGKALFMSAIVVFFYCIALGAVVLALKNRLALPLFFPYFIWGAGAAVLLVTALAYANHYGERALRKPGVLPVINAAVIYVLLVIVTLIVALTVRIDFASISQLSTYVLIPIIFFIAELIFGIVYYFLTRPAK